MARRFAAPLLTSFGLTSLIAACGPATEVVDLAPAALELSAKRLEFGEVPKGQSIDKEVTISNGGDVPMGIKNIFLASSESAENGHSGAFKLIWNCGDVEVPNLGDTDSADTTGKSRGEAPPSDTFETGGIETGSTGQPPIQSGECVIPPGGRLNVRARFQPNRTGGNRDAMVIETEGVDADAPEYFNVPPDEYSHRDVDTTWKQVYLLGDGGETTPRALVSPKLIDFGFVFKRQERTQYFSIRNDGDGELRLLSVEKDGTNCSADFSVDVQAEMPAVITADQAVVATLTYSASTDRKSQCRINVKTDDPSTADSEQVTTVLGTVNGGTNPSNQAPSVTIHSPAPGYQHQGMQPIPLELSIFDPNEPTDNLYCKVRSALQGIKDGRPALADCRAAPGNPSGHQVVEVPVDFYVEPGLEVLLVRVTDSSGVTREASVPVLINAAFPASDDDGDGFGTEGENRDCDDTNADIHPFAAEKFDGRDNDCDRLIDEGTDGFDDDGDGMSEAQGDCDDANPDTYKGGPEKRDQADNDCDGIVDETTAAYDDDGDGYTELERDCDDADPTVSPGGQELCGDGIDNDCDQIPDEADPGGCISTDAIPMIVGRIDLSQTSIEEGETLAASVESFAGDDDTLVYEWEVQGGAGSIDDPGASTINWTAPDEVSDINLTGDIFRIYAIVRDGNGNQAWSFEQIRMYRDGDLDVRLQKLVEVEGSGCSTAAGSSGFGLGLLGLVGLFGLVRRRENAEA